MSKKKYIKRPFPRKGVDWYKIKRERREDEISQINYTITKLEMAEQDAVDEENYEKAQLMLMEKARLVRRRKYLETKIKNK